MTHGSAYNSEDNRQSYLHCRIHSVIGCVNGLITYLLGPGAVSFGRACSIFREIYMDSVMFEAPVAGTGGGT